MRITLKLNSMLKNILNLDGIKELTKEQQLQIKAGLGNVYITCNPYPNGRVLSCKSVVTDESKVENAANNCCGTLGYQSAVYEEINRIAPPE